MILNLLFLPIMNRFGLIYRDLRVLKYFVNSFVNFVTSLLKLLQAKLISINRLNERCILANELSSILLNDKSKLFILTIISLKSILSIKLLDKFKLDKLLGRCSILTI